MTNRADFTEKLKMQLDDVNAHLDTWQSKAEDSAAEARQRYDTHIENLRNQRDTATQKLADLQGISDDGWAGMQGGVQTALDSLHDAFIKAKSTWNGGRGGSAGQR